MTEPGFTVENRPWTISEIASWVLITAVILVLLIVFPAMERRSQKRLSDDPDPPDIQVLTAGRYIIGAQHMFKGMDPKEEIKDSDKLNENLKTAARTPQQRLQIAIVRGELQGKKVALQEIDAAEAADPKLRKDADYLRTFYTDHAATASAPAGAVAASEPATLPAAEVPPHFQQRYGWFADLARSFGKPDGDPARSAVLAAATRTVVGLLIGVLAVCLVGLAGLAVLIVGAILWFMGKMPPRFENVRPLPANRTPYVEAFAAYLSIYILGSLLLHGMPVSPAWGLLLLPLSVGTAIVWPLVRGQSFAEWRAAVGLHTGSGFFREIFFGALGYVAGLPVIAVGILITSLIAKFTGADPTHPITREITTDPLRIAIILLLASVWAPITEELMFRGTLFAHLRERWGFWGSALLVALVFAIIHPQGLAAVPALGSIALVLAAIREWRGSLLGSMTAHSINNTALILMTLLMIS